MKTIVVASICALLVVYTTTVSANHKPSVDEGEAISQEEQQQNPASGPQGRGIFDIFKVVPVFGPIIAGIGNGMTGQGGQQQQQKQAAAGQQQQFTPEQLAWLQQQLQAQQQGGGQQQMTQQQYDQLVAYQKQQQQANQG